MIISEIERLQALAEHDRKLMLIHRNSRVDHAVEIGRVYAEVGIGLFLELARIESHATTRSFDLVVLVNRSDETEYWEVPRYLVEAKLRQNILIPLQEGFIA